MKKNSSNLITILFTLGLLINPVFVFSKDTTTKNSKVTSIKLPKSSESITEAKAKELYGKLPMSFEINKGQVDDQVKFLSRNGNYTLFLTGEEAVFSLKESKNKTNVMRMQLSGSKKAEIVGEEELPGKSNYLIGNDSKKWRTDISRYAKVKYKDVYAGIDLVYYGNQKQLEYDFVVSPGAKVEDIKVAYKGADQIVTNKQGELILKVGSQEIKQHRPYIYQEKDGQKIEVAGNYEVKGKNIGFKVENYDLSKPLVIDPVLTYEVILNGAGSDIGNGIAVDSEGSAYITGYTDSSTDFPTTSGAFQTSFGGNQSDAFVTKLNSAGTTVYSTYLGGDDYDIGKGIAVDSTTKRAYITGQTSSTNFPLKSQVQIDQTDSDAFITELNSAGNDTIFSTYLGGNGIDRADGIAVNSTGIYVTGLTFSAQEFPISPGAYQPALNLDSDAFVTKLNSAGTSVVYSTYLGGDNFDEANGIAVDSTGAAYVTGRTNSTDFPTSISAYQRTKALNSDAFVTKLNSTGTNPLYSTYLGGNQDDQANGIAIDAAGAAHVTGQTTSTIFPVTPNGFSRTNGGMSDGFLARLNPLGTSLTYGTYLGGSGDDIGHGIVIDNTGASYVTVNDYVIKINSAGNLSFSFRVPQPERTILLYGIAIDRALNVYLAGYGDLLVNSGGAYVAKLPTVITITPTSLPSTRQTLFYFQLLSTTNARDPFYYVSAGTLPPGLTLDPAGFISGKPTVKNNYSFTITVVDADGFSTSRSYSIRIQ